MSWQRFQQYALRWPTQQFGLDCSRLDFTESFLAEMEPKMAHALDEMEALEDGAIANPDEQRMVGHYWLRAPHLAPSEEVTLDIEETLRRIDTFAGAVHRGEIAGATGPFTHLLVVGIGGSALGPQFVAQALGHPDTDKLKLCFFDNTDPDGIDGVLAALRGHLGQTLTVVISKSGGTPETRNGMLEAEAAYRAAGLSFAPHAVAITSTGSNLDKHAVAQGWLARFPMWDWVGGRTSETSAVGLLPAALQGFDIHQFLAGAAAMDQLTRQPRWRDNPAAWMALMWYWATEGKGRKDLVILPYKDRLGLFAKYLQQLIMESLGKEKDLAGQVVHQGIAVYGNKGSTDQHAYVQQLREGVPNFFATFVEVLRDRAPGQPILEVEPGVTSGDYLQSFFLGTRDALSEKGRQSLTITIGEVSAFSVGQLIALFERTVGLYATLIGVNAYHQPGVEAGKKAAAGFLKLKSQLQTALAAHPTEAHSAPAWAAQIGATGREEAAYLLLRHLAANPAKRITLLPGTTPADDRFQATA